MVSEERLVALVSVLSAERGPSKSADESAVRIARALVQDAAADDALDALLAGVERARERPERTAGLGLAAAAALAAIAGPIGLFTIAGLLDRGRPLAFVPLAALPLLVLGVARQRTLRAAAASIDAAFVAERLARAGIATAKAIDAALYVTGCSPAELRRAVIGAVVPEAIADPLRIELILGVDALERPRLDAAGLAIRAGAIVASGGFWVAYALYLGAGVRSGW